MGDELKSIVGGGSKAAFPDFDAEGTAPLSYVETDQFVRIVDDNTGGGDDRFGKVTMTSNGITLNPVEDANLTKLKNGELSAVSVTEDEFAAFKTENGTVYGKFTEGDDGQYSIGDLTTDKTAVASKAIEGLDFDDSTEREIGYKRLKELGMGDGEAQKFWDQELNLKIKGEKLTSMQFDRWGKVGGMALALFDKVLQAAWMSHRAGIEDSMMTLAENKETNRYNLQWELVQKQSELQNTAMKYDYQKARIEAGTEKYKAKLAADVKKSKIKQDSLKDLFFPRNSYPNGNFAYA